MKSWNRHWYEAGLCTAIIALVILMEEYVHSPTIEYDQLYCDAGTSI